MFLVSLQTLNLTPSKLMATLSLAGRQLEFEDVWAMFGEGRHPDIARLFEHRLAPFMTQTSIQFWRKRLHYFRTGLYYQGGMVRIRGVFAAYEVWSWSRLCDL